MPPRRVLPSARALVIAVAVLVALAVAATGTVWAATRRAVAHGSRAPVSHRVAVRSSSPRTDAPRAAPRTTTPASVASRTITTTTTTTATLATLDDLDRLRARAFANRDAALFTQVYASRALLLADTQQLRRSVPAGCGLTGVRTTYRSLHVVAADGSHVVLTVTATLASSALICHGAHRSSAAGTAPTELRLELTRAGGHRRISAQRAV